THALRLFGDYLLAGARKEKKLDGASFAATAQQKPRRVESLERACVAIAAAYWRGALRSNAGVVNVTSLSRWMPTEPRRLICKTSPTFVTREPSGQRSRTQSPGSADRKRTPGFAFLK